MAYMSLLIRWILPIREQKIELGPHLLQGFLLFLFSIFENKHNWCLVYHNVPNINCVEIISSKSSTASLATQLFLVPYP